MICWWSLPLNFSVKLQVSSFDAILCLYAQATLRGLVQFFICPVPPHRIHNTWPLLSGPLQFHCSWPMTKHLKHFLPSNVAPRLYSPLSDSDGFRHCGIVTYAYTSSLLLGLDIFTCIPYLSISIVLPMACIISSKNVNASRSLMFTVTLRMCF